MPDVEIAEIKLKVDGHEKELVGMDKRIEKLITYSEVQSKTITDIATDFKVMAAGMQKLDDKLTMVINLDKDVKHMNEKLSEIREQVRVTKHDVGNLQAVAQLVTQHHEWMTAHNQRIMSLEKTILTSDEASRIRNRLAEIDRSESRVSGEWIVIRFLWGTFGVAILGILGWVLVEYVKAHFGQPQDVNVQITGQR